MPHERFTRPDKSSQDEASDKALVPDWAAEYAANYHNGIYHHPEHTSNQHTKADSSVPDHTVAPWYRSPDSQTSLSYPRSYPNMDQPGTQRPQYSQNWAGVPTWYPKHNNRFSEPSRPYSRYDDVRQTYRYGQDPFWPRMSYTIDSMVGKSIRQYDPSIPENLGCARFVSAVLQRTYGLPITDAGIDGLEQSLRTYGFVAMPLSEARPGDIIIGHRAPGEPGHAAIYVGDNQIANNNSFKLRISVDYINKFYAPEFTSVVAYRRLS